MIKNKKGMNSWILILIILILIGGGIGIYYLITKDSSVIANSANSIPRPPALPG